MFYVAKIRPLNLHLNFKNLDMDWACFEFKKKILVFPRQESTSLFIYKNKLELNFGIDWLHCGDLKSDYQYPNDKKPSSLLMVQYSNGN